MTIIKKITDWREILRDENKSGKTIGLIPTMGALHAGHISLVERSVKENVITAATIFVNPTQFNNPDDLTSYPSTWDKDVAKLEEAGVDYLLHPSYEELYHDNYSYRICESRDSTNQEGTYRPGHFDGVLTVVMKLLNISHATRAYFGEKDWQQYSLIEGMAQALFIDTQIIPCKLIREDSGLAMSSRNKLLSDYERDQIAPLIYRTISSGKPISDMRIILEEAGFTIDYLEEKDGRFFAAAYLGKVRLIDNVKL